jgi:hypothetical protein
MITPRSARIGLYARTARLFGRDRARRLSAGWRAALTAHPELVADLYALGFLAQAHVHPDGTALSAPETDRREGARFLALAILARAQITELEMKTAIEEMDDDADHDDPLAGTGPGLPARPER